MRLSASPLTLAWTTPLSTVLCCLFLQPASVPDASADRAVEADVEEERVVLPTLSEAELSAPVTLSLSESETFTLFSLPSLRVLQDTEEFHKVTARNEAYTQLVQVGAALRHAVSNPPSLPPMMAVG